jgi:hypothetical protein
MQEEKQSTIRNICKNRDRKVVQTLLFGGLALSVQDSDELNLLEPTVVNVDGPP